MSRNNNNNNNNNNNKNNASEKKYCKVCQDAGKPESEFYSHFTRESRDPTSKVTCPLLLALECRYCFKSGHTVKYCPSIKAKDKQNRREEYSYEKSKKASNPIKNTPQNVFTCLNCDSDDDDTNVKNNSLTNEFPELVQLKRSAPLNNNSYAAALATVVPLPLPAKIPDPVSVTTLEVKLPSNIKRLSTISWADMESDTDDDDDDEEEKMYNSNVNKMVEVRVGGYDSDW